MNRIKKLIVTLVIVATLIMSFILPTSASVWTFGTSGSGSNPFTPRGYMIKTNTGLQYLNSKFDNSTGSVVYTGTDNGLSYIDAYTKDTMGKKTNISYTLYALTDRNPAVYQYLFAYKNGVLISDFGTHLGTPIRSSANPDYIGGVNNMWTIPINDFKFEPGCKYEFGYCMGMRANNGITLTLAKDSKGRYIGYLQNPSTADEQALYDSCKNIEYQYVSSYEPKFDTETNSNYYNINFVPMRFSVQTYADLTTWETKRDEVKDYLKTAPSTVESERLLDMLEAFDNEVQVSVKLMLQPQAETRMAVMVEQLESEFERYKKDSVVESDTTKYDKSFALAEEMYEKAKINIGSNAGQYGKKEVTELGNVIKENGGYTSSTQQTVLDDAVIKLDTAVIKVKDSKVLEDVMRFVDRVTRIVVQTANGSLPEETVMFVTPIRENDSNGGIEYRELLEKFDSYSKIVAYKIEFKKGDEIVHPKNSITVQIPVGDISKDYSLVVNYFSGSTFKKLPSVSTPEYILTKSNDSGYFVIGCKTKTAQEKLADENKQQNASNNGTDYSKNSISDVLPQSNPLPEEEASIMKETTLDLDKSPDIAESYMQLGTGNGQEVPDIRIEGDNTSIINLNPSNTDYSEATIDGNENYVIIFAGLLATVTVGSGIVVFVKDIIKKQKGTK